MTELQAAQEVQRSLLLSLDLCGTFAFALRGALDQNAKYSARVDVFRFAPNSDVARRGRHSAFVPEADVGPALRRRPARCSSHLEIRLCGSLDKSKLCQGRHTIVEADLLNNLAVLELQDGRTGELHLASRVGG
jgi:hypothetical protein